MDTQTNSPVKTPRRLAIAATLLCIGCCALPLLAAALGFTAAAALGFYLERTALGLILAAAALWVFLAIKRRPRACNLDRRNTSPPKREV